MSEIEGAAFCVFSFSFSSFFFFFFKVRAGWLAGWLVVQGG